MSCQIASLHMMSKKVHKDFSKCKWKQLKILLGSSDELEEADMHAG